MYILSHQTFRRVKPLEEVPKEGLLEEEEKGQLAVAGIHIIGGGGRGRGVGVGGGGGGGGGDMECGGGGSGNNSVLGSVHGSVLGSSRGSAHGGSVSGDDDDRKTPAVVVASVSQSKSSSARPNQALDNNNDDDNALVNNNTIIPIVPINQLLVALKRVWTALTMRLRRHSLMAKTKIMLTCYQICSGVPYSLNITLPAHASVFLEVLTMLSSAITSLSAHLSAHTIHVSY